MRLSQARIVMSKDFQTFRKRRNILYSIIFLPLFASFGLPLIIDYSIHNARNGGMSATELTVILPAFTFFYIIMSGIIPTTIASYSIVGEKVEKSLEPLLATPTTDGEVLFGKGVAAFLPSIIAVLGSSAIFMTFMDVVTHDKLGYYFFPNWAAAITLLLIVPLALTMSVEWNVLVSSRVSDVRIAQQVGVLIILPLAGIYLAGEINLISLGDTGNLLIVAAALGIIDLILLYVVRATFMREEILTKWK
jgi:ABC-type transport system involved in multi-copper enzyme maturation permease subunit